MFLSPVKRFRYISTWKRVKQVKDAKKKRVYSKIQFELALDFSTAKLFSFTGGTANAESGALQCIQILFVMNGGRPLRKLLLPKHSSF